MVYFKIQRTGRRAFRVIQITSFWPPGESKITRSKTWGPTIDVSFDQIRSNGDLLSRFWGIKITGGGLARATPWKAHKAWRLSPFGKFQIKFSFYFSCVLTFQSHNSLHGIRCRHYLFGSPSNSDFPFLLLRRQLEFAQLVENGTNSQLADRVERRIRLLRLFPPVEWSLGRGMKPNEPKRSGIVQLEWKHFFFALTPSPFDWNKTNPWNLQRTRSFCPPLTVSEDFHNQPFIVHWILIGFFRNFALKENKPQPHLPGG